MTDSPELQSLKQYVDQEIATAINEWQFNALKTYTDQKLLELLGTPPVNGGALSDSPRIQALKAYIDQKISSELGKQEYQLLVNYVEERLLAELGQATGGTVALATATIPGILRTNTTAQNPVTYLKDEVDALVAPPQTLTPGTYANATITIGSDRRITSVSTGASSGGGGTTPTASALTTGTVKTNATAADPVVYLKTEVDSLVGSKADSTFVSNNFVSNSALTTALSSYVLSSQNTTAQWNANQLQGRAISTTVPSAGQALAWDGSSWSPQTISGGGGGGEANTASNVGVGGVGLFRQKTGVNLEFRNINAASNKISISLDSANQEVDIDVNESNLTLTGIGGTLSVAKGGTGATTASAALTNLGAIAASAIGAANGVASLDTSTLIPVAQIPSTIARLAQVTASQVGNTTAQWNANQLQGRGISATTPTTGQALAWDGTNWTPQTVSGGGSSPATTTTSGTVKIVSASADPTVYTREEIDSLLASYMSPVPVIVSTSFTRPSNTTAYSGSASSPVVVTDSTTSSTLAYITLANIVPNNGGSATIAGARLVKGSAILTNASFRLWLFDTAPSSLGVDNSVFALTSTTRSNRRYLDFNNFVSGGSGSNDATAQLSGLSIPIKAATGSRNLWGILTCVAAYTPGSGESFLIEMQVI